MVHLIRTVVALAAPLLAGARRLTGQKPFLAVLLRTGGPSSPSRLESIRKTWGKDLEENSMFKLEDDDSCKSRYGDNHGQGLSCLEAMNHLKMMNRSDFEWLLVVDDDTYVFANRLRRTLRTMDPNKPQVFGAPYCGNCAGGGKGFCGGGGYVLSRQSLLKMASSQEGPVPPSKGEAFMQHFMTPPDNDWADVRFGCVAREKGLELVGVRGMYGYTMKNGDEDGIALMKWYDPPLVFHMVRNHSHMQRLENDRLTEEKAMGGKETKMYTTLTAWKDSNYDTPKK